MKLTELTLKGKDRFDYKDVGPGLSWRSIEQLGRPDVTVKTNLPGIVLRVYQRGNGFKIVVSDDGKPIGFIDFVRPKQLAGIPSRKLARNTFTPHSGIKASHTGQGIVSAVYRWFLDAGHNLITGNIQTEASNRLWRSLSRHYDWQLIDQYGHQIVDPTEEEATDPTSRIVLFGKGQSTMVEEQDEKKPETISTKQLIAVRHGIAKALAIDVGTVRLMSGSMLHKITQSNLIMVDVSLHPPKGEKGYDNESFEHEVFIDMFPKAVKRAFTEQGLNVYLAQVQQNWWANTLEVSVAVVIRRK